MYHQLRRAYGEAIKTKKELLKAWEGGKDFEFTSMFHNGGRYCSISDFKKGEKIEIRFDGDRKVHIYTMKADNPAPVKEVEKIENLDGGGKVTIHQTFAQAKKALSEGIWKPKCTCGRTRVMEPDASGYTCDGCGCQVRLVTMF